MSPNVTTVREALLSAISRLEASGIEDARRMASWMLEDMLGVSRTDLLLAMPDAIDDKALVKLDEMVARKLRREPIQYVLGHADFYGLRFTVTPDVLIPRPETEVLVETALHHLQEIPSARVLDVGTGSGCIACAIQAHAPESEVAACDVSPRALDVAAQNARKIAPKVSFFWGDLSLPDFAEDHAPFDLIVSNPPYIPEMEADGLQPEVRNFEPHLALFAGNDPLHFYRLLLTHGQRLLAPSGRVLLEGHIDYLEDVRALAEEAGWLDVRLIEDLTGRPRVLEALHPNMRTASR